MACRGCEEIAIAGGACARIGEASGGDDQALACPGFAGGCSEDEGVCGDACHLRITLNFDTDSVASADERVDDIRRVIRGRIGPVSALDYGGHSGGLEPIYQLGGSEVEERRLQEIGVGADVLAELVPILHVGEVASALAGDHYLPPGAGHLLQQRHRGIAAGGNQHRRRSVRGHQPGCTTADYDDIRLHRTKKGKA